MDTTNRTKKRNSLNAKQRIRRKRAAVLSHIQKHPEERIWNGARHTGKPVKDLPMRYLMAQAKKALKFERGFLLDEIARRNTEEK